MNLFLKNKNIFVFLLVLFIFIPVIILAQTEATSKSGASSPEPVKLCNPLSTDCGKTDNPTPQVLIGRVLNAVLGIVGSLALLMFIYGGFTWMLAGGNQEMVTKGKNILIWATIGLIVIFSAYALVKFVFGGIGVS